MRVALIHYWFVGMRGGEKVIEALCRIFPQADIFTHVYVESAVSEPIKAHRVRTSFINSLPYAARLYKKYLPLMPIALEQLDLRGYDLIISSESGPAKGIIPPPEALHICYCHSPMRYIWNMYHDYRARSGPITRLAMPFIAHYVRSWDAISSNRVDCYVANSLTTRSRIHRYYRRDSVVIPPPVNVSEFEVVPEEVGDFYLMVGELVPYKRPDLAIEAFNQSGLPLVVIGGGEMLATIRRQARQNIKIMGPQPFSVLRHHYARCKALIFPGEEDAGIVPLEAQASGRPVIAFGKGGATETVVEGQTGVFFNEQSCAAILDAVERLGEMKIDPAAIASHAQQFSVERFVCTFGDFITRALEARTASSGKDREHSYSPELPTFSE